MSNPPVPMRVSPDHDAVVIGSDAVTIELNAGRAFPPGQPLDITLWPDTPEALRLQARSIGSKLGEDQRFNVRARLINLSRDARARLLDVFRS